MRKRLMNTARLLMMICAILLVPSNAFAAYTIGTETPFPTPSAKESYTSGDVIFSKTGHPVFVSNAPESIYDHQVNKTLYRDTMNGTFRFWSSHRNMTTGNIQFFLYVKNPSATNSVKLYLIKDGYGDSNAGGDVTKAASTATTCFMSKNTGGTYLATIAPGQGYAYEYSAAGGISSQKAIVHIADFRAVDVTTGSDADVKISDLSTNTGTTNLAAYANTATIASTNYNAKTKDDYRGLLQYSGRTADINLTLTSAAPAKFITQSDDGGYTNEQDILLSRWNVDGNPQDQAPASFNGKIRGAYWCTDYTYRINITNSSGLPNVYTLYGSRTSGAFITYKISTVTNRHVDKGNGIVINDTPTYTLHTIVQPSNNLPLSLDFVAQ
ncbi:hypothetical protein [Paenibacillus chitinolyticus]|uniref:Uncharacterized protein n=2 Tax=Paenibacillus chitinolyticus TaxID=79263 RepID=A0ABT4FF86_9BACL|nr:hypothetical protein [Paenibacillus chitinolyticus]MCY9588767.1 hypothetical protein [Paenibacillus chitinolyticus]MCY9595729.1 hypothetical protein [Paenibacillus chitinolyticus]